MLGLGLWEIVIIFVTALVVLGPEKLPQVARQLARLLGQVRRFSDEVRRNFDDVMAEPVELPRHDAPRPVPQGVHQAQFDGRSAAPACDVAETTVHPAGHKPTAAIVDSRQTATSRKAHCAIKLARKDEPS